VQLINSLFGTYSEKKINKKYFVKKKKKKKNRKRKVCERKKKLKENQINIL
jgi:hypothetical protein